MRRSGGGVRRGRQSGSGRRGSAGGCETRLLFCSLDRPNCDAGRLASLYARGHLTFLCKGCQAHVVANNKGKARTA